MWPVLLLLLLRFSPGETKELPSVMCGFGFELLLAKLESIEQRLIGLEERFDQMSANTTLNPPHGKSLNVEQGYGNIPDYGVLTPELSIRDELHPLGNASKIRKRPQKPTVRHSSRISTKSCRDVSSSNTGIYLIQPTKNLPPFEVACEMTMYGGGWTVIQHRPLGNESFNRTWSEYEEGFGRLNGDFWLGLKLISAMVNNGLRWEIGFVTRRKSSNSFHALTYKDIRIDNSTGEYALLINAGESENLERQWIGTFSTFDRGTTPINCAAREGGGWWYSSGCSRSTNLNGRMIVWNMTSILIREILPTA